MTEEIFRKGISFDLPKIHYIHSCQNYLFVSTSKGVYLYQKVNDDLKLQKIKENLNEYVKKIITDFSSNLVFFMFDKKVVVYDFELNPYQLFQSGQWKDGKFESDKPILNIIKDRNHRVLKLLICTEHSVKVFKYGSFKNNMNQILPEPRLVFETFLIKEAKMIDMDGGIMFIKHEKQNGKGRFYMVSSKNIKKMRNGKFEKIKVDPKESSLEFINEIEHGNKICPLYMLRNQKKCDFFFLEKTLKDVIKQSQGKTDSLKYVKFTLEDGSGNIGIMFPFICILSEKNTKLTFKSLFTEIIPPSPIKLDFKPTMMITSEKFLIIANETTLREYNFAYSFSSSFKNLTKSIYITKGNISYDIEKYHEIQKARVLGLTFEQPGKIGKNQKEAIEILLNLIGKEQVFERDKIKLKNEINNMVGIYGEILGYCDNISEILKEIKPLLKETTFGMEIFTKSKKFSFHPKIMIEYLENNSPNYLVFYLDYLIFDCGLQKKIYHDLFLYYKLEQKGINNLFYLYFAKYSHLHDFEKVIQKLKEKPHLNLETSLFYWNHKFYKEAIETLNIAKLEHLLLFIYEKDPILVQSLIFEKYLPLVIKSKENILYLTKFIKTRKIYHESFKNIQSTELISLLLKLIYSPESMIEKTQYSVLSKKECIKCSTRMSDYICCSCEFYSLCHKCLLSEGLNHLENFPNHSFTNNDEIYIEKLKIFKNQPNKDKKEKKEKKRENNIDLKILRDPKYDMNDIDDLLISNSSLFTKKTQDTEVALKRLSKLIIKTPSFQSEIKPLLINNIPRNYEGYHLFFGSIFNVKEMKEAFYQFLEEEHNTEPFEFLECLDKFKNEPIHQISKKSIDLFNYIFETFIADNSPQEINIHGILKKKIIDIKKNQENYIEWKQNQTPKEVYEGIKQSVIHDFIDTWPRFYISDIGYKVIAENLHNPNIITKEAKYIIFNKLKGLEKILKIQNEKQILEYAQILSQSELILKTYLSTNSSDIIKLENELNGSTHRKEIEKE